MARKEFTYRGKNLKELQELSLNDFMELLPSAQRRKIKRGFTKEEKHLIQELKNKDNVKTHCREMIILPEMIGKTILIHNGKVFNKLTITEEMIGHIIGEFSLTRNKVAHSSPGVGATRSSGSTSVK
ncbi:MAG: 30S ribosomal protein S19 [Candidatus Woesearchaeota archaeon]